MELIQSFSVDHTRIVPGIFTSRVDTLGDYRVTTYDIRLKRPNREPVMDQPAIHTIEHLGATFLRNSARKAEIVYFGPMGCRTGFYLLMFGSPEAQDALPLVKEMCTFILGFEGEIPGAKPEECGNYSEQNLNMAKYYVRRYLRELTDTPRLAYPGARA